MPVSRKKIAVWIIASSTAILLGAVFLSRNALLESWYVSRLDAASRETRIDAIRRLAVLRSAKAVPKLAQMLGAEEDPQVFAALEALEKIGPRAEAAAPAVVRVLLRPLPASTMPSPPSPAEKSVHERLVAASREALAAIGPRSIPHVLAGVSNTLSHRGWSFDCPERAFRVLVNWIDESLNHLVSALKNGDLPLREFASDVILSFGPTALETAVQLLSGGDSELRAWARGALVTLSVQELHSSPEDSLSFIWLLDPESDDDTSRKQAAQAIARWLSLDLSKVRDLERDLEPEQVTRLRVACAQELSRVKESLAAAVPHLLAALKLEPEVRHAATESLARLGNGAAPSLLDLLGAEDESARRSAEAILWEIASRDRAAVHTLALAHLAADEPVRRRILRVLDLARESSIKVLKAARNDGGPALHGNPALHNAAVEALRQLGEE